MKRTIKALAVLLTLALVISLAAMSASAVNGGTTNFDKHLVADSTAQIPNVEFEFTLVPVEEGVPGDENHITINPGIGSPTVGTAEFTNSMTDNATTGLPTDDGTATSGKIYATDSVTMDFSSVNFTAPGIYRYLLTETPTTDYYGSITNDSQQTRYVDVIVAYDTEDVDEDGDTTELYIVGYAMRNPHDTVDDRPYTPGDPYNYLDQDPDVKLVSFTNAYTTADLTFEKTISGNQADTSKKFTFTLEIENAIPGQYAITTTGTNVFTDGSGVTDGKITVGADGTYTGTFSLTNNESVTVVGLNTGYTYTLSEDAEDYTSTGGTDAGFTDGTVGQDGTITASDVNTDISTGFNNDRQGIIPTGVIITVAPFMIGLLLFGAVMMFMISRRRRATY